ncbi:hypothetical protein [Rhizobium grahamii]|uniref:Uncharacterized protein n=1 Tax=Rhizobium grahamii CCGE 502 TaxID=990285 RepID=S3H814_9HYPH|nr:hypothetical protein [Rhizobium grahamii]EPE94390.1 hypothetical protein RGCCGE502_31932 [Rhizobium grahamii CCGE 502]
MDKIVTEIAAASSVPEDAVRAVLSQLGLGDTIDRIRDTIGENAVRNLKIGDLSVSARVANLIVSR